MEEQETPASHQASEADESSEASSLLADLKVELGAAEATRFHDTLSQILEFIASFVLPVVDELQEENVEPTPKKPRRFTEDDGRESTSGSSLTVSLCLQKILQMAGGYPESFDAVLRDIAQTSVVRYPWLFLRMIFVLKVFRRMDASTQEMVDESLQSLRVALGALWHVGLAPLGARRACELLLHPDQHYHDPRKLSYALIRSLSCLTVPLTHRVPASVDELVIPARIREALNVLNPGPPTIPPPPLPLMDTTTDDRTLPARRHVASQDSQRGRLSTDRVWSWGSGSLSNNVQEEPLKEGSADALYKTTEEFKPHDVSHQQTLVRSPLDTRQHSSRGGAHETSCGDGGGGRRGAGNILASAFLKELAEDEDDEDYSSVELLTGRSSASSLSGDVSGGRDSGHAPELEAAPRSAPSMVLGASSQLSGPSMMFTRGHDTTVSPSLQACTTQLPSSSCSNDPGDPEKTRVDLLAGAYFDEDDEQDCTEPSATSTAAMDLLSKSLQGTPPA